MKVVWLRRRALLALLGKLAPLGLLGRLARRLAAGAPPPAIGLEEFLDLSTRLTGRKGLDRETGRTYLTALLAVPRNAEWLSQLAARGGRVDPGLSPTLADLERQIIAAWYTGLYRLEGKTRLATHAGALMWRVLDTPAPGTCVGPTGFWSKPPRGAGR